MKAFKKWDMNNKPYLPLLENTIEAERRKAWRAALELIMMHEMHRYGYDFVTDKPMNVLYEFIRDELKS